MHNQLVPCANIIYNVLMQIAFTTGGGGARKKIAPATVFFCFQFCFSGLNIMLLACSAQRENWQVCKSDA